MLRRFGFSFIFLNYKISLLYETLAFFAAAP